MVCLERLVIIEGNITGLAVDAIVNVENNTLLNSDITEKVRVTSGYNSPAKHVIHMTGPVWDGGNNCEDKLLAYCYQNVLEIAEQNDIKTIAFPSINIEDSGFPVKRAARIAIKEIHGFLETDNSIEKVFIVCFDSAIYEAYISALEELTET